MTPLQAGAIAGGVAALGVVGVLTYRKIQSMSQPAYQTQVRTYVERVADHAAQEHLATGFGFTPEVLSSIRAYASRMSAGG